MAALLSQPLAGVGVTDACREEAEAERQHDNIEHGMFLCVVNRATGSAAVRVLAAEVPPGA
jgi:hypothetical protein